MPLQEKGSNNAKLWGPSCVLKNVAIWLRKQTFYLVSDTSVVSVIYLKTPHLLEEINLYWISCSMLVSNGRNKRSSSTNCRPCEQCAQVQLPLTKHLRKELKNSDIRRIDGVIPSIRYFTEKSRTKRWYKKNQTLVVVSYQPNSGKNRGLCYNCAFGRVDDSLAVPQPRTAVIHIEYLVNKPHTRG